MNEDIKFDLHPNGDITGLASKSNTEFFEKMGTITSFGNHSVDFIMPNVYRIWDQDGHDCTLCKNRASFFVTIGIGIICEECIILIYNYIT